MAIFTTGSLQARRGTGCLLDGQRILLHGTALDRTSAGTIEAVGSQRPDVEHIPADLDRFLGNFFDRRGWTTEIKFDPDENQLFLHVKLGTGRLSDDDRFFSLIEYFVRAQAALLRRASGLTLECRLFAVDGTDLTGRLHTRGGSYLDDGARSPLMRRKLAWLGFRRRLLRTLVPTTLLWAVAFAVVVGVIGLPFSTAVWIAIGALLVQTAALTVSTAAHR